MAEGTANRTGLERAGFDADEQVESAGNQLRIPLLARSIDEIPVWNRPANERRVRYALFAFLCLLFLPNLGAFGLWDPWETHYGAVTTNMVETHEWVSTWWGYKEKIGTEAVQGKYFFSKPIFIFWSEAMAASVIGHGEWAIRLPMALLAIFAAFMIFLTVSRIWSRPAGLLAAVVVATSPEYFMISRQAQTDMPFVATLVLALCGFMMALFGPRGEPSDEPARRKRLKRVLGLALAFVALNTIPQFAIIATDLADDVPTNLSGIQSALATLQNTGALHVVIYTIVLLGVLASFGRRLWLDLREHGPSEWVVDRWVRRAWLVFFYVLVAQSTYAKGLLGFALPGLIVMFWLIFSVNWRVLLRVEFFRGIVLCLAVGLPWYIAMFARHGNAYYQRFIVHDHLKRLGSGVHQIDSGTFEHFIKWLGVGMFPWSALVPFALAWMFRLRARDGSHRNQALLFVAFWFSCSFAVFTISSTKFHHYIFPAMPALGILVAIFLVDLLKDRTWLPRLAAVVGALFLLVMAWDLHEDQQHIRNLMTYKYDRPMPEHLPIDPEAPVSDRADAIAWQDGYFWKHSSPTLLAIMTAAPLEYHNWIKTMAVFGLLSLLLLAGLRTRRWGVYGLALMATAMTMWGLNYYMPSLSTHWSQKYLFDSYYDTCTPDENPEEVTDAYTPLLARVGLEPVAEYFRYHNKRTCEEDVISWRITWRGETYYSYNELKPITKEATQFLPYLEEHNGGEPFYILMERGKTSGFKSKLDSYSEKLRRKGLDGWDDIERWETQVMGDENKYFQMIKASPVRT